MWDGLERFGSFFPSRGSRRVGELSTLPEQSAGLSAQLIAAVRPAITGRTKTIKFVASPRNPRAFWFPIAECNNYFASRFSAELLVSQISHSTDGQLQEECPVGSQAVVVKRAFEISVPLVLSRRTQSIYWRRWQSLISQKQCFSLKKDSKQICKIRIITTSFCNSWYILRNRHCFFNKKEPSLRKQVLWSNRWRGIKIRHIWMVWRFTQESRSEEEGIENKLRRNPT